MNAVNTFRALIKLRYIFLREYQMHGRLMKGHVSQIQGTTLSGKNLHIRVIAWTEN